MAYKYTPVNEIPQIHTRLSRTFDSGKTLPLEYRRTQLLAIARLAQENTDALQNAIKSDLGRCEFETNLGETGPVISACISAADSLEEWSKPVKPAVEEWRSSYDTTIHKAPKGIVINIAPWNYPFILSLLPLVGAIAAGCTCVIKPSEYNPTFSALLTQLIAKYLDPEAYTVVNGAVTETTRLLELRWDHVFYTGGNRVGRIVAAAAAKHITPVTLELGGKSPVFVDAGNTDFDIVARRVLWGKIQNAGQVCVAPDYVLVPRNQQDALVTAFKKAYDSFWPYPKGPLDEKSQLPNVNITPTSQDRIKNLIARTQGTIVMGGLSEGKRVAPTIVKDVKEDDILMEDEIFGPVLPIVPVDDVNEAIRIIRGHPSPLVIYVFTECEATRNLFIHKTRSGQITFNDTFQQLSTHEIPFGGCGESGYGAYFGKFSFDTFTHLRGSVNVPLPAEPAFALRYPPYTKEAYNSALTAASRVQIPAT